MKPENCAGCAQHPAHLPPRPRIEHALIVALDVTDADGLPVGSVLFRPRPYLDGPHQLDRLIRGALETLPLDFRVRVGSLIVPVEVPA